MSFTETVKNYILGDCGMDAVGIAPADALDDERVGFRPEDILPGAKSIIVFLKRIPDGVIQAAFRAKEDGVADAFSAYAAFGRDLTPGMNLFFMQFNIAQYIERSFGCTAVPIPSGPTQNVTPGNTKLPVFGAAPRSVGVLNPARAAVAAGLGEIAWNNAFVTAENGPRQGIGLVLTSMELEYDAPYSGPRLCDPEKCGVCRKLCPTGAIPAADGKTVKYEITGKTYTTGCLNANACAVASMAFRSEFSGKMRVPDQIMRNDPDDAELAAAYAAKPVNHHALNHYPNYFCDLCTLYCPLGNWQKRYGDAGLSSFDGKELDK